MNSRPAIVIEIADQQTCISIDRAQLRRAARTVLRRASITEAWISLALVDDPTIARLNEQYLRHEGPTDVLSFVLEKTDDRLEGEVVLSAATAQREAAGFGWTPHDELLMYLVHGMLHLVGHDDATVAGRARMRIEERHTLEKIGVAFVDRPLSKKPASKKAASKKSLTPNFGRGARKPATGGRSTGRVRADGGVRRGT